ncbi:MAG: hypothetical protein JWP49_1328 [Phenylobacterium sp.]|nr:hypothetical protein [Phenylobacterium sp.]
MGNEPTLWTRRGAALAGLGAAALPMSARAAGDPLSGAALYGDVVRYDGFGEHRTGTPGDLATSGWLAKELRTAGYRVEAQAFAQPVFAFQGAYVEAGGRRIEAFPLWTPKAGEAAGPLSPEARPGAVAVLSFPAGTGGALGVADAWRKPVQAAIDAGAAGVVAITENPLGELSAFNVPPGPAPWAVPVVAVAGRDGQALPAGAPARVVLSGAMRAGASNNLVARRAGPGKPLVISTPKSGWFHCAGERGSGVAIWLGLARHLAARRDLNLVFMAASGHEFDGHGGHLFAEALAPPPAESRGWVHIGANVAAYDFALVDGKITRQATPQAGRRLAVSEALLPAAKAAFAGQVGYAAPADIDVSAAPGEIAEYQRRGYRPLVGIVGAHPLHHTRRDRADVTGPELLEPVARGLAALIARL